MKQKAYDDERKRANAQAALLRQGSKERTLDPAQHSARKSEGHRHAAGIRVTQLEKGASLFHVEEENDDEELNLDDRDSKDTTAVDEALATDDEPTETWSGGRKLCKRLLDRQIITIDDITMDSNEFLKGYVHEKNYNPRNPSEAPSIE